MENNDAMTWSLGEDRELWKDIKAHIYTLVGTIRGLR